MTAQKFYPEPYQVLAIKHMVNNDAVLDSGGAGMFLEMGLGKTVSALTAFQALRLRGEAKRMLVIAPLRVAEHTWPTEIATWKHTRKLRVSVVTGTENNRRKALEKDADVYCINREQVVWLVAQFAGKKWPFHVVCVDELSSFKSEKSARWKALMGKRPQFLRTWGLTGTPAPNGMLDLWPQMYLLDRGERLGKDIGDYKDEYFQEVHTTKEHKKVVLKKGSSRQGEDFYRERIFEQISDICISMKASDWLKIPAQIERKYEVVLHPNLQEKYKEFEREAFIEFENEALTAVNAAALTGKLLQFANGAVYTSEDRKEHKVVHDAKISALEDILEAANGKPILCFYRFKHDVERILKHPKLKRFKPYKLGKDSKDIDSWNAGEIPFLLAHPASAGHGLNMQHGGHNVVWFGLPWSLELFQQANARLHRKGQKDRVIVHVISVKGTMDERVAKSLLEKEEGQESLMQYLAVRQKEIKQEIREKPRRAA